MGVCWELEYSQVAQGRVAQVHFCSFLLTASTDERIPLLQYTGTLRNEGCPTRRVYAWGFVLCRKV
jgi:hypothetical protein